MVLPVHAKRLALVVGNAAYQGESVLRNPVNDAIDMAQALQGLGVQVFENKAHTNQSRQDMNALIGRFLNAAEGAELAVVFYAGHGIQSAGSSYLLPTDAKITDERSVRTEGISLNDLLADGADKRISRLVVILDACRNNPYSTRTRSSARGLAPPRETNGTLIAYATADGQVADDGTGRNGVYTEQLLRQLRANGNNKSIRDLLEDTQLAVTQARPDQRPKVYGDSALFRDIGWGGKIQLASLGVVPTGQPVQAQTDPEQEAWDLAKRRDTVAGYEGFLASFPNGRLAASARSALAGLKPVAQPAQAIPSPASSAQNLATRPNSQSPFTAGSIDSSDSGRSLASAKNCMACHYADTRKLVGPGFNAVASRYSGLPDATDQLVEKVMRGGGGVWGRVPMPANPQLNIAEARQIVRWILAGAK